MLLPPRTVSTSHIQGFTSQLADPETADLESLRELILRAAGFGVAGAVPLSAAGNSPDGSTSIACYRQTRSKKSWRKEFDSKNCRREPTRCDGAAARVFGKAFRRAATFQAANAAELEKALGDSKKVQDGDLFAVNHLVSADGARP